MNPDAEAAIIINDLDSLVYRVEALPPSPYYANALSFLGLCRIAVVDGRRATHAKAMYEHFAKKDTA